MGSAAVPIAVSDPFCTMFNGRFSPNWKSRTWLDLEPGLYLDARLEAIRNREFVRESVLILNLPSPNGTTTALILFPEKVVAASMLARTLAFTRRGMFVSLK